ncbi:glutathione S-transferase family protein [Chitinibacter bivalviorum]|uniref:glutathione transferase n=1 Tax=Chitinibacter bivalviorum TaxID=2739434 RepID=A0A7H9BLW4_9NEIS|nr:glutathione S-transferase family protein [Chitinibacter bivalviorum]QLG89366.1 glutathione S-transferase family protein [Chitinibacter bivalviorum]
MATQLTLISHPLCPYVQRAAIVLAEKNIPFTRVDIDLANKPDWFLRISPLGKTPLLLVDDQPIFESAVICEYLDETIAPALHPQDPIQKAQHRGWIEFASATLNSIAGFYTAPDAATLAAKADEIRSKLATLESALNRAPFFAGEQLSLVDAAFGPVFRYFEVFEQIADFDFFAATPKVQAWRKALQQRASIAHAVSADYPAQLRQFLSQRNSALAAKMQAMPSTAATDFCLAPA